LQYDAFCEYLEKREMDMFWICISSSINQGSTKMKRIDIITVILSMMHQAIAIVARKESG